MSRGRYNESTCRKVICSECFDRGMNEGFNQLRGGKRSSSRNARQEFTEKDNNLHVQDENGCCHNNYDTFQTEEDGVYYDSKLRSSQPKDKLLEENCFKCGKGIAND